MKRRYQHPDESGKKKKRNDDDDDEKLEDEKKTEDKTMQNDTDPNSVRAKRLARLSGPANGTDDDDDSGSVSTSTGPTATTTLLSSSSPTSARPGNGTTTDRTSNDSKTSNIAPATEFMISSSTTSSTLKTPPPGRSKGDISPSSNPSSPSSQTITDRSVKNRGGSTMQLTQQQQQQQKRRGRRRQTQPLEDIFVEALVQLTGIQVELTTNSKVITKNVSHNTKKDSLTTTTTTTNRLATCPVVRLTTIAHSRLQNGGSLDESDEGHTSWEDLYDILQNQKSATEFFHPFEDVLFPDNNNNNSKTSSSYLPTTMHTSRVEDGVLYNIASMYSASMIWVRDNASAVGLLAGSSDDDHGDGDDDQKTVGEANKQKIAECLRSFREWMIHHVVKRLRQEIINDDDHDDEQQYGRPMAGSGGGNGGGGTDYSDGVVELGLFQDESSDTTMAIDYLGQQQQQGRQQTPHTANSKEMSKLWQNNPRLLDEIFRIMGTTNGAGILGGSFMSDLTNAYDAGKNETTNDNADAGGSEPTRAGEAGASSSSLSLCTVLLSKTIQKLPPPDYSSSSPTVSVDQESLRRQLTTMQNLITSSSETSRILSAAIVNLDDNDDYDAEPKDGATLERTCALRPLFNLAALSVPRFATSSTTHMTSRNARVQPFDQLLPHVFHNMLCQIGPEYPVCVYSRRGGYDTAVMSYNKIIDEVDLIMKSSRLTGVIVLKKIAKAAASSSPSSSSNHIRSPFFTWLNRLVDSNESLNELLEADLLSPDTAQAYCSSRPFLLGLTTSLLEMTVPNLWKAIQKDGESAFDFRYFYSEKTADSTKKCKLWGIEVQSNERCLIPSSSSSSSSCTASKVDDLMNQPERFSGSTEFFFLIGALLRLSLFSGFRVDNEYRSQMRNYLSKISELADRQLPKEELEALSSMYSQYQKCATVTFGWDVFVRCRDLSALFTSFSLLQLKWVSYIGSKSPSDLARIPEWLVKNASQWLAFISVHSPRSLSAQQGVDAVLYSTQIMESGQPFSPPVVCQLIRISGSFIQEGVNRARSKERARSKRTKRRQPKILEEDPEIDFEDDLVDDRELDIYTSFDRDNLGVTVFTNKYIEDNILRQLMKAYVTMDHAEGIDVEKEYRFEKHSVKSEILDVFLWVWQHPNGAARKQLLTAKNADQSDTFDTLINNFSSSIAEALSFVLGHACQNMMDIRDVRVTAGQRPGFERLHNPLSARDEANLSYHMGWCVGNTLATRRMLQVLIRIMENKEVAEAVGQNIALSNMFLNNINRLCGEDGGLHEELELSPLKKTSRSISLLHNSKMSDKTMREYFLYSRRFMLIEYGFDASTISHALMAVAARIHLAARGKGRTSPFLDAIVRNDLCNVDQLQAVYRRLCVIPCAIARSSSDEERHVLERDGFVDLVNVKDAYKVPQDSTSKASGRRHSNRQDLIRHSQVDQLAGRADIEEFLKDLEKCVANTRPRRSVLAKYNTEAMTSLELQIASEGGVATDDNYSSHLIDFVVSSDVFQSSNGPQFLHSFDSIFRSRSNQNTQRKRLMQEARKASKILPSPHPSTSVFVCFAEESMDLCKACIVGPENTPFQLGLWLFDILFPLDFPNSPPLVKFLTTGNGSTRVSSNLYSDGKVCLSLLGTYTSYNEEQRWKESSTLAQVLVSCQQQLLNDAEPYFSEGFGHEGQRGTEAGQIASTRFNHKIRLHCVRYAMIEPLLHPPLGFETITMRHFALCRKRILCQVLTWTEEARDTAYFKSFVKAYEELVTLLSKEDIVRHRLPGLPESEQNKICDALPALPGDIRDLSKTKPCLVEALQPLSAAATKDTTESIDDSKPAAVDESFEGTNTLGDGGDDEISYEQHIGVLSWLAFNYFADLAVMKVLSERSE